MVNLAGKMSLPSRPTMWIALVVVSLGVVWLTMHLLLHSSAIRQPFAVAHRAGAGLAPENTQAAVREALVRGDEFIEVDVQRTSDGVLVIFHDDSVERSSTGQGPIGELTWEQTRMLDVGSHFSPDYVGEPIPTLELILELLAGKNVGLFLEAKNPGKYPGMEQEIAETLNKHKAVDDVVVLSFDDEWVNTYRKTASGSRVGLISWWQGNMPVSTAVAVVDVFWAAVILDPTLIRRAHNRGVEVVVWTVNSPKLMRLMLLLGVDGITTDYPNRWSEVMES